MAGPSSVDPVGEATLNIYKLYDRRKRAELDLQLAQAEESHGARTAVPGVVANLVQQRQKQAQQAQKIRDAQAQGQLSQAQMLPPMVPVTGDTSRGQIGQSIASEIADKVTGGRDVKMQLPGVGIAAAGAAPPPTGAPAGAQQPQVAPYGPGIEGAPPLTGLQRALSGVGAVLGIAGRNPQAFATGVEEAATGQRVIGYRPVPTVDQMAESLAPPISVYRARMASHDPAVAAEATKLHDQAIDRVRQEFGDVVADKAAIYGEDLYYMQDMERFRQAEDPLEAARRAKASAEWEIEQKVLAGGEKGKKPEEVLNPGELDIYRGRQTKGATVNLNMPQPPLTDRTRGALEMGIKGADDLLNKLNAADEATHLEDGSFWNLPFEVGGYADKAKLTARAYTGTLSPDERVRLQRYSDVDQTLSSVTVEQMHTWLGATMSDAEIKAAFPMLPSLSKNAVANEQDLKHLRENIGLAKLRYETILQSGSMADPRYAKDLSWTKNYARELVGVRIKEAMASGLSEAQAAEKVRDEFRRGYGLSVDALLGIQPSAPALR